ncbi:MAG: hypothetical protein ACXVCY_06615 [Pseudobdellovibrionaceae bacterium]
MAEFKEPKLTKLKVITSVIKGHFILFLIVVLETFSFDVQAAVAEVQESTPSVFSQSNQWHFDNSIGFIQFSVEKTDSFVKSFDTARFRSTFDSGRWSQFQFDSQTNFAQKSLASFWYNYSVGLLQQSGQLYDINNQLNLPLENTNILSIPLKLGLEIQADWWRWISPSLGYSVGMQNFRISSSMSGAEMLGTFYYHGPVARIKVLIPSTHLAVSAQWTHKSFMGGDGQYFQQSDDYAMGVGWLY